RLNVRCGFDAGWALLTLDGRDLYSARVIRLRKGEQQVEAPLKDPRMRLLHADLIALDAAGNAHRATRLLFVQPARGMLRVTADAHPAGAGELAVDLKTTDAGGRPTAARCFADLVRRGREPERMGEAAWAGPLTR